MLEDGAHKEILEEDYERYRQLAEKFREREEYDKAAKHYRKSADLVEQMAALESSERLAEKRRSLSSNLREAAEKFDGADSESTSSEATPASEEKSVAESERSRDESSTGAGGGSDDGPAAADFLSESPEVDFDDVGGMTSLKQELIDKVVDPLERPELYEEYNLGVVNGVLLHGPPGTGKTYITRALAGKLDYNFIDVTPADLTSSLVGEAADNVADLFTIARENQPCLVFFDEIDAVAGQRSGGAQKTQSERQMVNQLLTELSEIQGEDVVVFAATNLLEAVDDAIKRSGRFDERIEVPPPGPEAREAILRVHLRDRPVLAEAIDWSAVKSRTEGYVASDLELIATTAARKALHEAREADSIQPVTQSHLEAAIEETEPGMGA